MYGTYICVCAKNGKNISNPLSFCNIYYIYRTYTYLLSFQVRQRHVQFNCLLTRDKIEFHESPFEENSERLYITSCEYVPTYNIYCIICIFCAHDHSKFCMYYEEEKKEGNRSFSFSNLWLCAELNFFGHEIWGLTSKTAQNLREKSSFSIWLPQIADFP